MNSINGLVNNLIEFSQQKLKLMQEILQLSKRMAAEPEFDKIEKHLIVRKDYINKIDIIDQQILLLKDKLVLEAEVTVDSWEEFKKQYPELLTQLESIAATISQAAREAKELTEKSRANAEQRLKKIQIDMKKMQSSKTGMVAYHNKPKQHSGYFLDKKK